MRIDFRESFKLDDLTRFQLRLLGVCIGAVVFGVGYLLDLLLIDQFGPAAEKGIMISDAVTGLICGFLAYRLMRAMASRQQAFISQLAVVAEMSRQLRSALALLDHPLSEPAVRVRTERELENVYGNLKELTSRIESAAGPN
jgi:ABC-type Co2+ transport system permease subunit